MFTVGVGYILATVSVFLRDMIYMWGIMLTILNYFTPLFYSLTILPEKLQTIFKLNPLYLYINASREILLYSTPPSLVYLLACLASGALMLFIGLHIFRKRQDKFVYYM